MKQRQSNSSLIRSKRPTKTRDFVYVDLEMKNGDPSSISDDDQSIQISRRFLQCRSSMPVSVLRTLIQSTLCLSPKMQISFFDAHDRPLKDNQHLKVLKSTRSSLSFGHIPIRFTLFNPVTGLDQDGSSSLPVSDDLSPSLPVIEHQNIDQILSTYRPALKIKLKRPVSSRLRNLREIDNLPSSSWFPVDRPLDESMMNEILSTFGEIYPSPKSECDDFAKDTITNSSWDFPLDLRIKKTFIDQ